MKHILGLAASFLFLFSGCASAPNYEKITSQYVDCGGKKPSLVEFADHDWYKSWYAHCGGKEYFCRYSPKNEHGWNGCRSTKDSQP
jgi:hypothetical protein